MAKNLAQNLALVTHSRTAYNAAKPARTGMLFEPISEQPSADLVGLLKRIRSNRMAKSASSDNPMEQQKSGQTLNCKPAENPVDKPATQEPPKNWLRSFWR